MNNDQFINVVSAFNSVHQNGTNSLILVSDDGRVFSSNLDDLLPSESENDQNKPWSELISLNVKTVKFLK